jgi:hypothetical protein
MVGGKTMIILETKDSIMAAIAVMPSAASEATKLLAEQLSANPSMLRNEPWVQGEWLKAVTYAYVQQYGGSDCQEDHFRQFVETHGDGIMSVALSIIVFQINAEKRRKLWGWIGKAAAVGAGIVIGSFFS